MLNSQLKPATADRELRCLLLRARLAAEDGAHHKAPQIDNGDEEEYSDKSGTYTKGILQKDIGLVDLTAYRSFKHALATGDPAEFEKVILGGPRTQNGPQGGLAFYLQCLDADQFTAPPAPKVRSEEYAAELIEMYWASLLRDTAFTEYAASKVAQDAASELSSLSAYAGPRDHSRSVTPHLLFRGTFAGETDGPYLSQFLLQKTALGALPIDQKYATNDSANFMCDPAEFLNVQNGISTGKSLTPLPPVYLHNGRGLTANTHVDILYQSYFLAGLVLETLNAPANPGNPYIHSKTQNGFATLGSPDLFATLAAVADEALKAVWYQKWWVHLRHRPESGGAIVHLLKTGKGNTIQAHVGHTVLGSEALRQCFAVNNSYFLSQAFPEGSPTHPSYPTGHGTVAGACITVLKFFFDGGYTISDPIAPSPDGATLSPYHPATGEKPLTVNGELHKLASNISFGHGIHAGIHWRSDTETSIRLGEAVALSFLRDRAHTYNERFSIPITKLDGSVVTISN